MKQHEVVIVIFALLLAVAVIGALRWRAYRNEWVLLGSAVNAPIEIRPDVTYWTTFRGNEATVWVRRKDR